MEQCKNQVPGAANDQEITEVNVKTAKDAA